MKSYSIIQIEEIRIHVIYMPMIDEMRINMYRYITRSNF